MSVTASELIAPLLFVLAILILIVLYKFMDASRVTNNNVPSPAVIVDSMNSTNHLPCYEIVVLQESLPKYSPKVGMS